MSQSYADKTLNELLQFYVSQLEKAGAESPRHDCIFIFAHVFGKSTSHIRSGLILDRTIANFCREDDIIKCTNNSVNNCADHRKNGCKNDCKSIICKLEYAMNQRINRVPLQHIIGKAFFYGETLKIGKGVFIPRPETEVLVDFVLQYLARNSAKFKDYCSILDLCSGSGAIPIALAKNATVKCEISAVEKSGDAYAYLRENVRSCLQHSSEDPQSETLFSDNNCSTHISDCVHTHLHTSCSDMPAHQFTQSQMCTKCVSTHISDCVHTYHDDALQFTSDEAFDVITCNPPYVPVNSANSLSPEVLQDPEMALFGDIDEETNSFAFTQRLIAHIRTAKLLKPGGLMIIERMEDQETLAEQAFLGANFENITHLEDLTHRSRFTYAFCQ